MHGLAEVDRVHHLDAVAVPFQQPAALDDQAALRVCHHIGRMALHQVGLEPESGLAAARAADNQHVLVAGIRRILRTAAHCEPFRLRQNHVVFKLRIDKRFDVFFRSPRSVLSSAFLSY